MKKTKPLPLGRIFLIPAVLFAISLGGLIWALLVDGPQDIVAALAVALSLAISAVYAFRRKG